MNDSLIIFFSIFLFALLVNSPTPDDIPITKNGIYYEDKDDYEMLVRENLIDDLITLKYQAKGFICTKKVDSCKNE